MNERNPVIIRVLGRSALIKQFGVKVANEIIASQGSAKNKKLLQEAITQSKDLSELSLRLHPLGLFVYQDIHHVILSDGGEPDPSGFKEPPVGGK